MAQEELLMLRKEHIGEPCKVHLVIDNIFNVKSAVEFVEKDSLRLDPFVFLAEALREAQPLEERNYWHLFDPRSFKGKLLGVFLIQRWRHVFGRLIFQQFVLKLRSACCFCSLFFKVMLFIFLHWSELSYSTHERYLDEVGDKVGRYADECTVQSSKLSQKHHHRECAPLRYLSRV